MNYILWNKMILQVLRHYRDVIVATIFDCTFGLINNTMSCITSLKLASYINFISFMTNLNLLYFSSSQSTLES